MKVLMVEPGTAPYEKELNGLHEMQAAVGGLIQAIYPFEDKVAVVCDDEGMLKPNEFNRSMPGGYERLLPCELPAVAIRDHLGLPDVHYLRLRCEAH